MKKVKNVTFWVKYLSFILLGALVVFLLLRIADKNHISKWQCKIQYSIGDDNRITVPVTIKGILYRFLWDTGCSATLIKRSVAEGLGLDVKGVKAISQDFGYQPKTSHVEHYAPTDIKIGEVLFNVELLESLDNIGDYDGVIGGDIINSYYWFLDSNTRIITLSNCPIQVNKAVGLILNYTLDCNTPVVDVLINNEVELKLLFDTGYAGSCYISGGDPILPAIHLVVSSEKDKAFTHFINRRASNISGQPSAFYGLDSADIGILVSSMTINRSIHKDIFMSVKIQPEPLTRYQGVLAAQFLTRYRAMYYDPFDKKIYFYESGSDALLYRERIVF